MLSFIERWGYTLSRHGQIADSSQTGIHVTIDKPSCGMILYVAATAALSCRGAAAFGSPFLFKDWGEWPLSGHLHMLSRAGGFYDANNLYFYAQRTNSYCGLGHASYHHY